MTPLRSFAVLMVLILLEFCGCTRRHVDEEDRGEAATVPVVAVKTAPVVRGDVETSVTATGKAEALRKAKIFSPVAGTLVALKVLEGTHVKRGDVVVVVQPRETRTVIAGAEALLRLARTDAEREEAEHALTLAKTSQNNVEIRAEFDGVVGTRNVTEGELVTENAELLTVVDLSTLVFVADVPLHDARDVWNGERALVLFQSDPGLECHATVDAVSPQSDGQTQTVRVRLRFQELTPAMRRILKSDMTGIARIITGSHRGVLMVPKSALLRNDETNTFSVFIATGDSLARSTRVIVGAKTDSTAEVAGDGLEAGVQVVLEGNYALADSARITAVR